MFKFIIRLISYFISLFFSFFHSLNVTTLQTSHLFFIGCLGGFYFTGLV
ncbi:hypothetical protein AZO1586I_178 [Bathymodiolus thermophilus thioautotrophic gill symbiont]|uniref:Uncharacterized protein n=1 Tax=Bathymodiolus thermophilus thioautotrophic gill symbiont TaxID=2360 RepID=A0ABN7G860_9GAMM|nr:hypothetical protein AZO1586I_178 [Bathymodiolus thermophilus thioautotrophic gill symbiont]CAC9496022.1 hypothetical protein [uncultured Gammaproteobacteria bacterium]